MVTYMSDALSFQPLREPTFFILLSLAPGPKHGYAILKEVEILSQGPVSALESEKIKAEPAYSNISEIGFGVLKDFGLAPIGEILLDEKLGLHIAFGRSDHFGGAVGVGDFSAPDKVVHIDRIYIPETQNRVHPALVEIAFEDGSRKVLMKDGKYLIFS